MKWETIKENCIREFVTTHRQGINFLPSKMVTLMQLRLEGYEGSTRTFSKDLEDKVVDTINNWDIRCFKTLKDLFPRCFPKNVSIIELTNQEWELL